MEIIDERDKGEHTFFNNLCIGDCFMDKDGDLCIKTGEDCSIYTATGKEWHSVMCDADDKVIPLEATLTIKKKK